MGKFILIKSAAQQTLTDAHVSGIAIHSYIKKEHYYFELRGKSGILIVTNKKLFSPGNRDYAIAVFEQQARLTILNEAL